MKIQLLPNESVIFEQGANMVGAAISKGGKIILTNQRLIFESSILGANAKQEVEIPLNDIVGYRHAYTVLVGMMLPVKNSFSVFTNKNVSHKFTMNKRDELFQHFKALIPSAELLPDEKYTESVAGAGGKVVSNIKSAISGAKGNMVNEPTNNISAMSNQAIAETMSCPNCGVANPKTGKFCSSCGGKLQFECPNCHAPIEDGKKFCAECGTPIKRNNECPNCGAEFSKEQKFCNECGENLLK